ncbi:MAG: integral rane sensor signal transduction histidine kinase [Solirubrobacterales bacterium]|nr:integral rane sensor signal transduction histidine kinase [Solirubrobacterales bacterium]
MRLGPRMAIGRLAPAGLRWRLAGWVALVTLICTGITFVVVYRGTGTQLRHQIDRELSGDAGELAHNLSLADAATAAKLSRAANRYIHDQPFSTSSTLLFAIVPGQGTSTNRPELFTRKVPERGESSADQTRENAAASRLLSAPMGYSTLSLPDVGELRLLTRAVRVAGDQTVTIGAGEPLAAVAHAQSGVAQAFILAGILALAGAIFAAYLVGVRVSRPLRRMAAVAARVDAGDLHPRIHDVGAHGDEVKVLADAFNHMLDRLTDAFAGQRAFVADASHELRTPLTVIRGQLEVLAAQSDPSSAEVRRVEHLAKAEIARISRLVDDLLLLAKAEQTQFLRVEWIDLAAYVGELWDGMSLLAVRRFELGPVPSGALRADPDRLAQALRNLVGNSIDHTIPEVGLVRMRVEQAPAERVRFIVEDDGPGIPLDERERVFHRFHRTDAARDRATSGTGLGLAIVRAIADAHGGTVKAGESPEGGARIELELPGFTPAFDDEPAAAEQAAAVPVTAQTVEGTR